MKRDTLSGGGIVPVNQEIIFHNTGRLPRVTFDDTELSNMVDRAELARIATALLKACPDPAVRAGILLLAEGIGLEVQP